MAVDTMQPRGKIKPTHATVQQLLALSAQDADKVSCFVDGADWGDAQGAIFVVPNGVDAKAIYELFAERGYLTRGKSVSPGEG